MKGRFSVRMHEAPQVLDRRPTERHRRDGRREGRCREAGDGWPSNQGVDVENGRRTASAS